jgi:DNA-directed RNA polymerase specialized sigma24 family protein
LPKQSQEPRGWEETLFSDLEKLDPIPRVHALGEAISRINPVLSELARNRRQVMMDLIESGDYSYPTLAHTVGMRVQTVRRLVDEARAQRRTEEADAEAA